MYFLINRFINFNNIMKENNNFGYPFLIMNTNRANKKGTQWWSFLDFHQKMKFFHLIVLVLMD